MKTVVPINMIRGVVLGKTSLFGKINEIPENGNSTRTMSGTILLGKTKMVSFSSEEGVS